MTWRIWLCGGWLASEGLCALWAARARSKNILSGDALPLLSVYGSRPALMIARRLPPVLISRGGPPGHPCDACVAPL